MAKRMLNLVHEQDGFLGVDSAREDIGITVSYWRDLESIKKCQERDFNRDIKVSNKIINLYINL